MTTRHKDEGSWVVPWIHQADWQEMLQFAGNICEGLGESRVEVMRHINDIIAVYEDLEVSLSGLCGATVPPVKMSAAQKLQSGMINGI